MDARFGPLAAIAARSHGVVSRDQVRAVGLSDTTVHRWVRAGLLVRLGPRSLAVGGAPATWRRALAAALVDAGPHSVLAGRSGARLNGLDGFIDGPVEVLLDRDHRWTRAPAGIDLHTTRRPIDRADLVRIDGLRVLRAERLIIESPLFGFTQAETENAIDSAIRLRLVAESRLRERAFRFHTPGVNGGRTLLDALVDAGGEGHLERRFLGLVRRAGLGRPVTQVVHRRGGRHVARVDFLFGADLVIEVMGHGTHSNRRQVQTDAQRHTELTLAGRRVLSFTYADVVGRPAWVLCCLAEALGVPAA